jgi:hypothetical protein
MGNIFIQKKNGSIQCSCGGYVQKLKDYERDQNRHDPEWFWEPWDSEDEFLYICNKCKTKDFISDSEMFD